MDGTYTNNKIKSSEKPLPLNIGEDVYLFDSESPNLPEGSECVEHSVCIRGTSLTTHREFQVRQRKETLKLIGSRPQGYIPVPVPPDPRRAWGETDGDGLGRSNVAPV